MAQNSRRASGLGHVRGTPNGSKKKSESPENTLSRSEVLEALRRVRGLENEIAHVLLETQEKVQQLEYLNEFASLLNSSLDTSIVREKALEATCKLLRCETASLLLVDPASGELYWESALGEAGRELQRSVRLPINNRSIAGYVAMTGESLIVNDVENDPRHFRKAHSRNSDTGAAARFRARTMVCVPLKNKGRTIGVLQALNKLASAPPKPSMHSWPDFQDEDRRMLETLSHQVSIAVENSRLYTGLKQSFFHTVEALAESIEKKDRYTGGHTKRVVYYSMSIAAHMDLDSQQLEWLRWGAVLHDVGKIGIEDAILKKAAPLTPEEWKVMQTHPELGFDIMSRVEGLKEVIGGMRYHHERWDGKGYPLGLKGTDIPLIARIIAVADTYDAMVSTRPYRKGMDPGIALREILRYRGTQFDPAVVDAFEAAFRAGKMGRGSRVPKTEHPPKLSNCD